MIILVLLKVIVSILQLRYADLSDRIIFEKTEKIPVEIEAQAVLGKIEDGKMRTEAAIAVQNIYKKILNIMKKVCLFIF